MYVHLPADATNPTALAENNGGRLLTQTQVATWLRTPDTTVNFKPVIDLHKPLSSRAYEVPDRIKEHVELRENA